MSLATQITALTTRLGTEFKGVYAKQGNLTSLTTTAKGSLVLAVTEVKSIADAAAGGGGGAIINDTAPSTSTVYSSSKTESYVATAVSAKPSINDTTASSTSVYSSSKVDAQIAVLAAARPVINDTTANTTTVYSSTKTNAAIAAAISGLVNGAGSALDTLKELADALGNDANFAATTSTALSKRLRFDAAQVLSGPEQDQGRSNLGVTSSVDIGSTTTDFVASFEAALV